MWKYEDEIAKLRASMQHELEVADVAHAQRLHQAVILALQDVVGGGRWMIDRNAAAAGGAEAAGNPNIVA